MREPTTLSTALCRPTSSRTTTRVPSASNSPAACSPPVRPNPGCCSRSRSGSASTRVEVERAPASAGAAAASTSWTVSVPHTPQAELTSRAVGSASGGAARSTVTTLNSSRSVRVVVGAVLHRRDVRRRGHALVDQPAGGELEVVARRAHRHGDALGGGAGCRDPDLEGLLGGDPVLVVEAVAVAELGDAGPHRGAGPSRLRRTHTADCRPPTGTGRLPWPACRNRIALGCVPSAMKRLAVVAALLVLAGCGSAEQARTSRTPPAAKAGSSKVGACTPDSPR